MKYNLAVNIINIIRPSKSKLVNNTHLTLRKVSEKRTYYYYNVNRRSVHLGLRRPQKNVHTTTTMSIDVQFT